MSRKRNYGYERRQRELENAGKKAARLEDRPRRRERQSVEDPPAEGSAKAGESPLAPEGALSQASIHVVASMNSSGSYEMER